MNLLNDFVNELTVGETTSFDRLVIRPILSKTDYKLALLTLEDALERNVLEITEVSEDGSVPELRVTNIGEIDVIVLEGEELRGARQNRIVNATIIIPAHTSMAIPVSCVEQGRWNYVSECFGSGATVLYPSLRSESQQAVTQNLRDRNIHRSDQLGIWSSIREKSSRMCIASETEAMSDILDTSITPDAEKDLFAELKHSETQVGFLAFIGGGFAGGDVFGSSALCKKQLGKLLRGYYLDSLDTGVWFPSIEADDILGQIVSAEQEQFATIGKGVEMRFEAENIHGACKLVDQQLSHLTVFPKR